LCNIGENRERVDVHDSCGGTNQEAEDPSIEWHGYIEKCATTTTTRSNVLESDIVCTTTCSCSRKMRKFTR
jgi:hypothetical protein